MFKSKYHLKGKKVAPYAHKMRRQAAQYDIDADATLIPPTVNSQTLLTAAVNDDGKVNWFMVAFAFILLRPHVLPTASSPLFW